MGKAMNIVLGTSLGISIFIGVCTHQINQTSLRKRETKISELEKQLNADSIAEYERFLKMSAILRDTSNFYSDSLKKTSYFYNQGKIENKKLSEKVKSLSYALNDRNKKIQEKYSNLEKEYNALRNNDERLTRDYNILISENSNLKEKNSGLEKNFNKIKEDFEKEKNKNSELAKIKEEISLDVRNQNFFRNWKTIAPKFFGISGKFIIFKDNDPKEMEAFAKYSSGRLIPLKKLDDFDRISSFYLPEDFLLSNKEDLIIYATDKDGNNSKENKIYISKGIISKIKID